MMADQVQKLLRQIGLRPQAAAGQNFLLDEQVAASIVAAADVTDDDVVVEIGPGLGILTEALLATGAQVIAIEIDRRLSRYLRQRWPKNDRFILVEGDAFKVNLHDYVQDEAYKVVANLPYSGTSLFFRNFLSQLPRPTSLTVMVQRDVARRIVAAPGEMSLLSLMVQYYGQPSLLFDVPPVGFFPMPKVHSTVLHCDVLRTLDDEADRKLFRTMRAGFSARRKQLHNTLASSLHLDPVIVEQLIVKIGKKPTVRAQELSLENWLTLAKNIS